MMQAPLRLISNFRPHVAPAIIAALAVSTVVFTATPFLVPAIASDRNVDVAAVGLISTAQLSGFMAASYGAGRWLAPRRRTMVGAVLLGITANLLSAVAPTFELLLAIRIVSGISLGLVSWLAWAEAFGNDTKTGDVAVVGPIVGTAASPLVALLIDVTSVDWLFVALAALHLIPLTLIRSARLEAQPPPKGKRNRPTRPAALILVALATTTLGGSAVFIFAGAIGQRYAGLGAVAVSFVFAANALAGVPASRFKKRRGAPGAWVLVTASCAFTIGVVHSPIAFWVALPLWGFSFWMAMPGAFALLASRSLYPSQRAGDAQAMMAGGRVIGPLLGGALYAGSPELLGVIGAIVMACGATILLVVERTTATTATATTTTAGTDD